MLAPLSKEEIIKKLSSCQDEFLNYCNGIDSGQFFSQPAEKWSIAQHVEHLTISTNKTKKVYILPKFLVRYYLGKPNRPSRSYDELVSKYKTKLKQGGKASGVFVPKLVSAERGREKFLTDFSISMNRLVKGIKKNWTDEQLDQYLAPHPLLGKITLRELGYFTIHHTYHHLDIIRTRLVETANG